MSTSTAPEPPEHDDSSPQAERLADPTDLTLPQDELNAALVLAGINDAPNLTEMGKSALTGLVLGLDSRAKVAVWMLAEGEPRRSAAIRLGMGLTTLNTWIERSPQLRDAVEFAELMAVAPVEHELRKRALGGPADRGSPRALEMYLKRHDPAYRDQNQLELTVIQGARRAEADIIEGYSREVSKPEET